MKKKGLIALLLAAFVFTACGTESKEISVGMEEYERFSSIVDISDPIEETEAEEEETEDLSYEEEEEETETEIEEEEIETETETETEPEEETEEEEEEETETEKKLEGTVVPSTEKYDTTAFAGRWQDSSTPQTIVDITSTGTNTYHILVSRAENEALTSRWEFDGTYNSGTDRLDYTVCAKKQITKASDGSESTETVYSDGSGYMQILAKDGSLYWTDNKENAGASREFKKL